MDDAELRLVNSTILNNSYIKAVARKKERLEEVLDSFEYGSPTQTFAGGNPVGFSMGFTKKKEVFFFEEDRKAYSLLDNMTIMVYKKLDRNDICACGSFKKFKKCHLDAYNRINKVMFTFGRSHIKDFLIYGVSVIEKPIDEWSGYPKIND